MSRMHRNDGESYRLAPGRSVLGAVLVAAREEALCAVLLGDGQQDVLQDWFMRTAIESRISRDAVLTSMLEEVMRCIEQPGSSFAAWPMRPLSGTPWQERVWQALRAIPCGSTTTYSALARALDKPQAARAVGRACAENPIAILIPCHRVVRHDGALGGYRWGMARKRLLLQREGVLCSPASDGPAILL